jgi:glycosyltransferase involved in cell wall biosynthesis
MKSEEAQIKGPRLEKPVRITEQVWPEGAVPLVSVCCITYNHVNFIRDAIEGFLMQETTFPVEVIIRDDASSDGTAEIVRAYQSKFPQLIRTILHSENQYSQGKNAFSEIYAIARGEFIALCEGDDYWTAKEKLQKQFEDLQADETLSACCANGTKIFHLSQSSVPSEKIFPKTKSFYIKTDDLLIKNYVVTASLFFRLHHLDAMPHKFKCFAMGDWPLAIWLSLKGNILFDESTLVVYRIHSSSTWSSKSPDYQYSQILIMLSSVSEFMPSRYELSSILGIADIYFRFLKKAFFQGDVKNLQIAQGAIQQCRWSQSSILKKVAEKMCEMSEVGSFPSGFHSLPDCLIVCRHLKTILAEVGEFSLQLRTKIARSIVKQAFTLKSKNPVLALGIFCAAAGVSLQSALSHTFTAFSDYFRKIARNSG